MPKGATVYIWYPEGENIGHASMHIGAHQEPDSKEWYVSWWPFDAEAGAGKTDTVAAGQSAFGYVVPGSAGKTFDFDAEAEGGDPHVVYTVNDLNINAMKVSWDAIRNKPEAHYRLLPKNCSTIVARVLRAGGAADHLNKVKALSYAHNLYWTPKNVAQFCNELRNNGRATKIKTAGCPTKRNSKVMVFLGLR